jgi:hypothetical protein
LACVAGLGEVALLEGVVVDDQRAARLEPASSLRSAAGFIATSTFGRRPGVVISWSEMCTWNAETPGERAGRGPDLGREVGSVARSLPNSALALVNRSR